MRVVVKICGLSTPETVEAAVEAGADALGFVFARSPRQVDPGLARALLAAVPGWIETVGVFRRPDPADLEAIASLSLDGIQTEADWDGLDAWPPHRLWLPALTDGPELEADLVRARERVAARQRGRPRARTCDGSASASLRGAVLLDGPRGGGAGVRGDVARARGAAAAGRIVLAGGLDPDNVGAAIRAVRPFGVDVSSGVESSRGVKDPARIAAFLAAVRDAEEMA